MPYIDVRGVHTYYETEGAGDPLLLLHGGGLSGELWGPQRRDFGEQYRIFAPDRRAHGRTQDADGPLTYEIMADDAVAFMEAMRIGSAHIVGWSDGGNIAMIMAIQRPDLVRSLVSVGGNFHFEGASPDSLAGIAKLSPETFAPGMLKRYGELSPDGPGHAATMIEKLKRMWLSGPTLTTGDLGRITAPTLVVVADKDFPTMEHTLELYRSVPGAQLCVVPGATHLVLLEKPAIVNRIILEFLAAAAPSSVG